MKGSSAIQPPLRERIISIINWRLQSSLSRKEAEYFIQISQIINSGFGSNCSSWLLWCSPVISRWAHPVPCGAPLRGGSSPPEHINHWRHCYVPTLTKVVELEDCKATFLFLNQANLIWKPHGIVNVGFHNIACTELLFRMELCFNCWELFHHGNLASAIRLLAI